MTPTIHATGLACDICTLPITDGAMRGHGDGTGRRFAHEACYWREQAEMWKRIALRLEELAPHAYICDAGAGPGVMVG